jgi:hypothetical protein
MVVLRRPNSWPFRWASASLSVLLALGFWLTWPAQPSLASGQCGPYNQHHWFSPGYLTWSSGSQVPDFEGSSAVMTYEFGNLCTGNTSPDNLSASWVMVADFTGAGYAQAGYWLWWGGPSCWHHFAQQRQNGNSLLDTREGACVNNGEVHTAKNELIWNGSYWTMQSSIDGNVFLSSLWNPFAPGNWSRPIQIQIFGESGFQNGDIPGYMATGYPPPVDYNSIMVQSISNNLWYSACGNTNWTYGTYTGSRFASRFMAGSCPVNEFQTWTSG